MNARTTQDTPLWNTMRRSDFDASEPLTLFDIERDATKPVKADKCGTPDMFAAAEAEETPAPAAPSAVPTPGYAVRLMIFFDTTGNGRKVAYRWSPFGRAIRVPLADAEMWRATDAADVLPGHPLKP